jgi:hypothetical protein
MSDAFNKRAKPVSDYFNTQDHIDQHTKDWAKPLDQSLRNYAAGADVPRPEYSPWDTLRLNLSGEPAAREEARDQAYRVEFGNAVQQRFNGDVNKMRSMKGDQPLEYRDGITSPWFSIVNTGKVK